MQNPELPERIPEVDLDFMRALEALGANRMDLDLLNPRRQPPRPMADWGQSEPPSQPEQREGGDWAPQQLPPIGPQGSPPPVYQPPQAQADPEYAARMQAWEQRQGQNIMDLGHTPASFGRMVDRLYAQQQAQQQRQQQAQQQQQQGPQDPFEQELMRAMRTGNPQQQRAAEQAYLQMNLQRTALSQAEQQRLRRMQHALDAVRNHPNLSSEERRSLEIQIQSDIDPLEGRRHQAQLLHTQAQTTMINQQAEQQARLMQRDATFWASGAQDRLETFRDEDGNTLGYGITNRQGAQQFIPDTRSEQREQNALEFNTREMRLQEEQYQTALRNFEMPRQNSETDDAFNARVRTPPRTPIWMLRDRSQPGITRFGDGSILRQEAMTPAELEESRERYLSGLMALRRPNRQGNQGGGGQGDNPAPTSTPGPGYIGGARSAAAQAALQGRPGNNPLVPGGGGAGEGNAAVEQQQRQFNELLQRVQGLDRNAPSSVPHERVRELRRAGAEMWNSLPAPNRILGGLGESHYIGTLADILIAADNQDRGLTQAEEARYQSVIDSLSRMNQNRTLNGTRGITPRQVLERFRLR